MTRALGKEMEIVGVRQEAHFITSTVISSLTSPLSLAISLSWGELC